MTTTSYRLCAALCLSADSRPWRHQDARFETSVASFNTAALNCCHVRQARGCLGSPSLSLPRARLSVRFAGTASIIVNFTGLWRPLRSRYHSG